MRVLKKAGWLALPALMLVGCEVNGKVRGGGTMHSAGGVGKSVFTFQGEQCPDADGNIVDSGHVNFHDKTAIDFEDVGGVSFKGDAFDAGFCAEDGPAENDICNYCDPGYFELEFTYESKGQMKGEGEGFACVADLGKGKGLHGLALVQVLSGPYEGYANFGSMSGNVTVSSCNTDDDA